MTSLALAGLPPAACRSARAPDGRRAIVMAYFSYLQQPATAGRRECGVSQRGV